MPNAESGFEFEASYSRASSQALHFTRPRTHSFCSKLWATVTSWVHLCPISLSSLGCRTGVLLGLSGRKPEERLVRGADLWPSLGEHLQPPHASAAQCMHVWKGPSKEGGI